MKDLQRIISAYDRFVPFRLLKLLGKSDITDIKLGDQIEKRVTILFSDIRDFSSISESMTPQENFNFINSYLSKIEPLVSDNDGVIDKYIGDAIMAIFPENADDAINCSLSILKQLKVYNDGRIRAKYKPIQIGIGLNTGIAMIGTVGGHNRMDTTVISDAVNLCSRIESLTKNYKAKLLISESTFNSLSIKMKINTRFIDRILVKGKLRAQSIHEVFEMDDEACKKLKMNSKTSFEEGLANYHYGNINIAKEILEKIVLENENDNPARKYLDMCGGFIKTGYHDCSNKLHDRVSWNDQFLLGHEQIDKQHQRLIESSLQFVEAVEHGATQKVIIEISSGLLQKVKLHFETEELIMEKIDYPLIGHQKQQHEFFLNSFPTLVEDVTHGNTSKIFKMFKIQVLLIDWLVNHTLKDDRSYGKYLKYLR